MLFHNDNTFVNSASLHIDGISSKEEYGSKNRVCMINLCVNWGVKKKTTTRVPKNPPFSLYARDESHTSALGLDKPGHPKDRLKRTEAGTCSWYGCTSRVTLQYHVLISCSVPVPVVTHGDPWDVPCNKFWVPVDIARMTILCVSTSYLGSHFCSALPRRTFPCAWDYRGVKVVTY
jgi:hypothetical protein